MIQHLWNRFIEPRVQGAITRRILLFHDALVQRGQIPKPETPTHCTVETISQSDLTPHHGESRPLLNSNGRECA